MRRWQAKGFWLLVWTAVCAVSVSGGEPAPIQVAELSALPGGTWSGGGGGFYGPGTYGLGGYGGAYGGANAGFAAFGGGGCGCGGAGPAGFALPHGGSMGGYGFAAGAGSVYRRDWVIQQEEKLREDRPLTDREKRELRDKEEDYNPQLAELHIKAPPHARIFVNGRERMANGGVYKHRPERALIAGTESKYFVRVDYGSYARTEIVYLRMGSVTELTFVP